ncbi:putative surface protein with fasciclin (FAS1) repeats [Pontibacter aydingkolensis]|uniref:Fasciclin domain-containing protein n=1 Tax=Pontibacter aydingkolensis TaxID=1911536 RepID=A0ABS7CRQ4_9BACT|nr:fasciclin domain-containing protein [Pontibacter aydingkolensis]MBW7466381.1 fasciclin domain-containing protein [Pontibacter aydingkolensis]
MKKRLLTPVIAVAIVSCSLFGCAGSSETTAMESTTMSETQTMAGDTEMETTTSPALSVTNEEEYDEMFTNVDDTKQYDLISLAKISPNLSTFATLAETAGIANALTADGKYTIFAPTNQAFSSMPRAKLERLSKPENKAELIKVLQLHILPNEVASTRLSDNQRIKAGEDQYITINVDSNTRAATIGGATIMRPDIEASNGVLHVINGVITTTPGTGITR